MRPFTTQQLVCLIGALMLCVPVEVLAASPTPVPRKARKKVLPEALTITAGGPPGAEGFDATPELTNVESKLSVMWHAMSFGSSKYVEIHFFILSDGRFKNPTVWRSSGEEPMDRTAILCLDEAAPFGPFEGAGVDRLPCIATFHREPKGGVVTATMPGFMGNNTLVDKLIAAKRTQQLNTIKIMTNRIATAQKVLGANSPKLTVSINFLANTYKDIQDFKHAEGAFKWAISIREKANGPNSKELAESLSDLGDLYATEGDYVTAEQCFKRVMGMSLPPCVENRTAVQRYAKLCLKSGRKQDADLLFKRVTDMQSGKPLDPLPENMIFDASKPQDGTPKTGTASDTKGGDKSTAASDAPSAGGDKQAASGDKPAATTDKAAAAADKKTAPADKPAASSEQPTDLTPKPTDNKGDDKAVAGAKDGTGKTNTPAKGSDQGKAGDPSSAAPASK